MRVCTGISLLMKKLQATRKPNLGSFYRKPVQGTHQGTGWSLSADAEADLRRCSYKGELIRHCSSAVFPVLSQRGIVKKKKKICVNLSFPFSRRKGACVCVRQLPVCCREQRGRQMPGGAAGYQPAGTLILGALTQPEMPASRSGCAGKRTTPLPQEHLFWHPISLICSFHFAHSSLGVAPWSGTVALCVGVMFSTTQPLLHSPTVIIPVGVTLSIAHYCN